MLKNGGACVYAFYAESMTLIKRVDNGAVRIVFRESKLTLIVLVLARKDEDVMAV